MTGRELQIELSPDGVVVAFERLIDAPPDLVFDAWTQLEHLRHWWGPRHLELVVCEVDLYVGGGYRLVQRAPDGQNHAFHGRYLELDRPHRLRRTFVYEGAPEHEALETVTFNRDGTGTLIHSESVFTSIAARDLYTQAGMDHGLRESHHRLDEWLEAIQKRSEGRS